MSSLSNQIALERAKALQSCISNLDRRGCDITAVSMDEHSTIVFISPPKTTQLKGDAIRVVGGHNNQRISTHQACIERCIVRWAIEH